MISNEEGGFLFAIDKNGSVIISDTNIHKLLPSNLDDMRNRYKAIFGCEI